MFFARLRDRRVSASTLHQAYRTLKTFIRWLRATGTLDRDPLAGMSIKTPATLPRVPTEDELRVVLAACPDTFVGLCDRALVLAMADAGLRAGEVLRLLVEDWNPQERSLFVRSGKGQKDRVTFVAPVTVRAIREHQAARTQMGREDFLFVDTRSRPAAGRWRSRAGSLRGASTACRAKAGPLTWRSDPCDPGIAEREHLA
jgi:integrase/recombinase XerC